MFLKHLRLKLIGVCREGHLLGVGADLLEPIDGHAHSETLLESAVFTHGPAPPVHLAHPTRAADELV